MKTTKTAPALTAKQTEKAEAIKTLKGYLKPGSTVYTILRHASASGMSRSIDLLVTHKGKPVLITYWAARAMGYTIDRNNGGIKKQGCGMDQGFDLVYGLSRTLFPKGFIPAKAGKRYGRNGTDVNERDTDGGYALNQQWL